MARILAVEPDPAQAAVLARVIERTGAEPVMADSKEAAIAALDRTTPDLILVSALLSPRDESELAEHLRVREGVDHVQILTSPLLAIGNQPEPTRPPTGFLSAFRRKRTKSAPAGCDADRYGDELKGYLKLALEARAEREAQWAREERTRQRHSRASEAGGASEASQAGWASGPGEASGAGWAREAGQDSSELIGSWDQIREMPLAAPTASPPIDQADGSTWRSIDEEPTAPDGETLDPIVEPVAAMDLASIDVVEAEWPSVNVELPHPGRAGGASEAGGAGETEDGQIAWQSLVAPIAIDAAADAPIEVHDRVVGADPGVEELDPLPDVEHSIEAPAAATVETALTTVGPAEAEAETEPAFVLTPPLAALDPEVAAVPEWDLAAIEHSIYTADLAPSLDFESQPEPERTPEIVEPAPMLAVELSPDPASPALAYLSSAAEHETIVEAVAFEDGLAVADTRALEAFETASGADPAPVSQAPFERASMPSLEFALGPDVVDSAMDAPEQRAAPDDDRFALSISSFELDRRESDDYLLAAANETFATARPTPPADFVANAPPWHVSAPAPSSGIEASVETADAAPAVEIWQALPDWVDSGPPLEAHMDHAPVRIAPSKSAELDTPASAKHEAPAQVPPPEPTPPPVDARWLATALDALRSDIQQLRTQASEPRAADSVVARPPVPGENKQASQTVAVAGQPGTVRAPVPAPPPPVIEAPKARKPPVVAKEPQPEAPSRKKKARKAKPVEDEWGMFDPSQAGVEALIAALDAKAEQEDAEEEEDELEQQIAPIDPEPVPAEPRPRLAPLSMWVHTGDGPQRDAKAAPSREPNDLRALLDGLAVPTQVASVSYPTGCRIRRVRMAKDPAGGRKKTGEPDEPVIILSRRALGRGAAGKDDQGPPTPY